MALSMTLFYSNNVQTIQSKLDLLVPAMFGWVTAVRGYAQMVLGEYRYK
jgi:hypothetical protein